MEKPLHRHASEIAFGDTDASGWLHFPNLFRHVEAAEHAFLQSRGVMVFDRKQGGWPRVKVNCDFKRPLCFGDKIEILLEISRFGMTSIIWAFEVLNASGETAAFGGMTTVRVNALGEPVEITAKERDALLG